MLRCKAQLQRLVSAGRYDLRKHTAYSQYNSPVRYICTRVHSTRVRSKLRGDNWEKRSTMIRVAEGHKLHSQEHRVISWHV